MLAAGSRLLTPLLVLVAMAMTASPAGAAEIRFEAERATFGKRQVKPVKDRSASGGRAVVLVARRGEVRKRMRVPALEKVRVRARGRTCGGRPRMVIAVDRRRKANVVLSSPRWRKYARRLRTRPGKHTFSFRFVNPRRTSKCLRRVALDSVRLVYRKRRKQVAIPAPRPPVYQNPVYGSPFPDPGVLDVGGAHNDYYAYATGDRFPMARSHDLIHWQPAGTAMTRRPGWTLQEGDWQPWAPIVVERPGTCPRTASPRCFVMFYVALNPGVSPGARCIGVATSPSPQGPFEDYGILQDETGTTDASGRLLGCGDDRGYSNIDPAVFFDADGQTYLYFSTTNRCDTTVPSGECPIAPVISVVRLSPDLLHAVGGRAGLLAGDRPWEGGSIRIVENPHVHKRGSFYYLFFSGGDYQGRYGMGYAVASSPAGPFVKWPGNPVLPGQTELVVGAGGGMIVTGPHGGDWLVYHGREGPFPAPRLLRIDPVNWHPSGLALIDGPTATPQPELP